IWSVDAINTSDFEKQMKCLLRTHKIISLEKLARAIVEKRALPERAAVVTFDDGYKDNYTNVFPILKKYNIPATVFLTTGHIGTDNLFWWDKIGYILCNTKLKRLELEDFGDISLPSKGNISQSLDKIINRLNRTPEDKKCDLIEKLVEISDVDIPKGMGRNVILSWEEVKEMNENGINFGAHTVTHPILTRLSAKQAKHEIVQSKKDIKRRLNKPVTAFSYPNGLTDDFNAEIIDLLKESGFICAVTRIPKMIISKTDLYELGRLFPGWNYESFKFCVSGLYSDLNNALSWF
ncbi:polysaccharide deacetylase family protein, partial [bacterium]|nr:polysaccharide deacetylase family protein [bacterium]